MTTFFYHGAHRWEGPPEIRKARKGQIEHGPGLYLTTSIDTARKYAKGGGVVLRFEVETPLRWLEDARIPQTEMERFVLHDMPGPRARRLKVIEDIRRHAARFGPDPALLAGVLINLLLYYEVVKGDGGTGACSLPHHAGHRCWPRRQERRGLGRALQPGQDRPLRACRP